MSSVPSSESIKPKCKRANGSRVDPGWEHGIDVDKNAKKVKCMHCNKIYSGGIYRLKHHLAGTRINVESCALAPKAVSEKFATLLQASVEEADKKKKRLNDVGENNEEERSYDMERDRKGKGIMDHMSSKSSSKLQSTLNQLYKKGERDDVCQQIARFLYTSAIPFNVVNNPEFAIMIDKVAKFGMGFKPPSFHEVRVKFLKKEVTLVSEMVEEHKQEWKKTGCTIMSDGWTDRQRRTLCNFLVNSPKGTVFLSSIDASDISKTADKIFEMLDDVVERVGEENVIQVVSDNAANYKAAGEKLMEKRKRLYWTPCAAHCIDLMLEDFDKKIKVHGSTIEKAKRITTFIYSRTLLHTWLKEFTKGRELIRPGATRFATSYLTLRCLNEQRGHLMGLFASSKWKSSKFAATTEGKTIQRFALDNRGFWHGVTACLKASLPLVKVLRMVDSDEPMMGFIYDAMEQARNQIKANFNNVERQYKPILDIIDARWGSQLHRPLHAAAYYLNPHFQYRPDFKVDAEIKLGLYDCLGRMVRDHDERVKIDMQMDDFKNAKGLFGLPTAVSTRNKKAPANWWDSYGDQCPELKRLAIRILSLTCSSSGCERNWSAFEMVHTKKRNRLHQEKLNDLVFVMYNLKLKHRQQKQAARVPQSFDLDDIPSDDEWITEAEDPILPNCGELLNIVDRALHDECDNFESQESSLGKGVGATCVGSNEVVDLDDLATNVDDGDFDDHVDDEDETIDIDDDLNDSIGNNRDCGKEDEALLDENCGYDDD